jgi:uncharacterized membrane protein (UPF0127 family)
MKFFFYYAKKRRMCTALFQKGIERYRGLMFRKPDFPLLFSVPSHPFYIHSFFVFFPFYAVWLDAHKRVLTFEYVAPFVFRRGAPLSARFLLEVPSYHPLAKLFSRR